VNMRGIWCLTASMLAFAYSGSGVASVCVKEDSSIEVVGNISLEAFPGKPNYTSVKHGDALELVYILTADSPREICTISPESGKLTSIGEVRRFQLSHAPSVTFTTSPVVYGRARVRGKVSVGMTAHYHAPAAIGVVDFQNEGEWSPPWSKGTSGLIPLTVSFRRAKIGPSLVAEVKNHSKLTLSVLVGIANPTTHKTREFAITLPPFREKNIGFSEGWPFSSGDRLLFRTATFSDVAVLVP
jgi:hypothetical protein